MKRLLVALASLALLSVTLAVPNADAGRVFPGKPRFEPLMWRSYKATGNVDSLYATIGVNGTATNSRDTSATFSLDRMAGAFGTHGTPGTVLLTARIWVYSSNTTISASIDSLALITVQVSNDGSTWFTALADLGMVPAGAGNRLACLNITDLVGAGPQNSGMRIANWSMARIIVQGTVNTIPQAQILLAYNDANEPALYNGEDRAGKWKVEPVKWVSNGIDSTTVALVEPASGAVVTIVSKAISMDDKATWKSVATTTGGGSIRAIVERASVGADVTVDSCYAAVEVSCDGVNWSTWTTASWQSSAGGYTSPNVTYSYAYDVPLIETPTNNTAAAAGQNHATLVPFIRVRVKLPLDSGTVVANMKLYLAYMPAY